MFFLSTRASEKKTKTINKVDEVVGWEFGSFKKIEREKKTNPSFVHGYSSKYHDTDMNNYSIPRIRKRKICRYTWDLHGFSKQKSPHHLFVCCVWSCRCVLYSWLMYSFVSFLLLLCSWWTNNVAKQNTNINNNTKMFEGLKYVPMANAKVFSIWILRHYFLLFVVW